MKITITPEAVPEKKKNTEFVETLRQFHDMDVESVRIDFEERQAPNIVSAFNYAISRSEFSGTVQAVQRSGKAYLIKKNMEE